MTTNPLNFSDARLNIVQQLGSKGFSVIDDFFPSDIVYSLRDTIVQAWQTGCFRHAGVGRGRSWELRPEIRNDKVLWLDQAEGADVLTLYLNELEQLRLELNQSLTLGLFSFEGHMAVFPPGARYCKHIDQFRDLGTRRVSCILYLNPDWQIDYGGALRLYVGDHGSESFVDIYPNAGRLVAFLSNRFYHEVLPATHDRYSITGWFKRRD